MRRWLAAAAFAVAVAGGTSASAATKTWDSGDVDDYNWNSSDNWNPNGVPAEGDSVIFDGDLENDPCVVNVDLVLGNFTMQDGYSGTISMSGTRRISLGQLGLSGGTFAQSSGVFQAPSVFIVRRFNRTGGTFTHNSGSVVFSSGISTHTYGANGNLYNVAFNEHLIGYWKFDENPAATAIDYSGRGWHLTRDGATVNTSPAPTLFYNPAAANLTKAGTDFYTLASHPKEFQPTEWTISAWVNTVSKDSSGSEIFTADNNFHMRIRTDGTVRTSSRKDGSSWLDCDSTATVANGSWHHVLATRDADSLDVWINGVGKSCPDLGADQTFTTDAGQLFVGRHPSNGNFDFDGAIDEVRVYSKALSTQQISALFAGGQPGHGVNTHKATDNLTVVNNLTLGSMNLDIEANTINVAGSWLNHGGLFTGTGAVTLSAGTTGKEIITSGQRFANLIVGVGAGGGWTLRDPLYVDGTLTLANGTLVSGGYRMHAGAITQSSGAFTHGSNETVIHPTASGNLTATSTFHQFRLEDTRETGLVGYWKFDGLNGSTVRDWSATGNSATLGGDAQWLTTTNSANKPTALAAFPDPGSIYLDGSTSTFVTVGTAGSVPGLPASNAAHSISFWVKYPGTAGTQSIFTMANGAGTSATQIGFRDSSGAKLAAWKAGGTILVSMTPPSNNAWHHVLYTYDPTVGGANGTHSLYVDGGDPDNSGTPDATSTSVAPNTETAVSAWFGTNSAAGGERFTGYLDDARLYSVTLTGREAVQLANGRYPGRGGFTVTLNATTTIANTVGIDNGTLATGGQTVHLNTTAGDTFVNGGTLSIASGTVNNNGNLSIYDRSALTMTGGTLKVGDTKTLKMDGTLTASGSPSIEGVGGNYNFRIGVDSYVYPVLDINGLRIRHTTADGVYINYTSTITTTVTRLDSLTLDAGKTGTSGSALMTIGGNAVYVTGRSNIFDRNGMHATSYNVKMVGDGNTANGETRASFGNTTCEDHNSAAETCETSDLDDDAGNDGVADGGCALAGCGVAQFIQQAYSDTRGSIAGYPTPVFDWYSFAYKKTYAAFNNYSGTTVHRLLARDIDGVSAGYHWDIPATRGTFVGAPRWDTECAANCHIEGNRTQVVYVVTSLGYVYRLLDTGSAFTQVGGSWPYHNGGSATATSPLAMDASNLYWAGLDSDGGTDRNLFSLSRSAVTLNGFRAVSADITGAPAVASVDGTPYLFSATTSKAYRMPVALGSELSPASVTSAVTGRVAVYYDRMLVGEAIGKVWALKTSDLTLMWSYTGANGLPVSALYYDQALARIFYGDSQGNMYAIKRTGTTTGGEVVVSNYPYRPTGVGTSDTISVAPVFVDGVTAYGTTTGKVIFLDAVNDAMTPAAALIRLYHFGSAISSVAYEYRSATTGDFMVGTADGHLYYLRRDTADANSLRDPTTAK